MVFPGPQAINFGTYDSISNFTGLGTVFAVWVLAPALTLLIAATNFIFYRNSVFRGEDCFHRALWVS